MTTTTQPSTTEIQTATAKMHGYQGDARDHLAAWNSSMEWAKEAACYVRNMNLGVPGTVQHAARKAVVDGLKAKLNAW